MPFGYVRSANVGDESGEERRGWVRAWEASAKSWSWSRIRVSQSASSSMMSADERFLRTILIRRIC